MCAEVWDAGAVDTIGARAATYVTDTVWKSLLTEQRQRPGGCDDLAAAARRLLSLRRSLRTGAAEAVRHAGGSELMAVFAGEMAGRMALPFDAHIQAVARGLQIAGICVCVLKGMKMDDCACFKDVLKGEGEARVEALVVGALEDWQDLPRRLGG
ncbi:hypothetical protein ACIRF8_16015 [Streptomyces sp. NPDC102406]|uniref:hypothetical protein n=1 Tax=Streptomyces sp. NPDC102406 TaxID=3366171 RepID=UPI0038141E3E